jgi:DNA-binding NarL/FixJ family response regulator
MIKIVLVDDQVLIREGLRILLPLQGNLEIVGEASNGNEAIVVVQHTQPDVVLMDVRMPLLDGVAATRALRELAPQCRILLLTTFDDNEYVFEGLRAGAAGYLLKDTPSDKLAEAIRTVARGDSFLQPSIAAKVVAEFARLSALPPKPQAMPAPPALVEPLSERELAILRYLSRGDSNKEIATALYLSEGTVKNHITNILGKLGVRDRTQAALVARERGLLG